MQAVTERSSQPRLHRVRGYAIAGVAILAIITAMVLDTKVVKIGSEHDSKERAFSADTWGAKTYPGIKSSIVARATDATKLAAALKNNQQEAVSKFGVGNPLPVFPVRFQGRLGENKSGIFPVDVDGFPAGMKIRLQTGPVLTGTELRDATGEIQFGDFTNQIEYQNAGSAINETLKESLLNHLDRSSMAGRHVEVVGVFRLLTPNNWLVTPVLLEVK